METNIDYKALYEEARERARQVKLTDTKENVAAAEYIFPDLKESEDERIRKEIIAFIEWSLERGSITTEQRIASQSWFAYLEKQKEPEKIHKPIEFKNDELVEIIKGEFEGFRRLLKKKGIDYEPQYGYWEGFARLFDSSAREYVKEQKPVDYAEELKKCKENPLYFYDKYVKIKMKPVDENAVDEIGKSVRKKWAIDFIHFLDEHRYNGKMCVSNGECMDIENAFVSADWEKLIRYYNKYTQKPMEKQDYSGLTDLERAIHRGFLCAGVENVPVTIIKETAQDCLAHTKPVELKYWDKEMIQSIISILERDNCFKVVDEKPMRIFAHEQEINYLRNLQEYLYPNPSWKPSEEEMKSLRGAIAFMMKERISDDEVLPLQSLYNDLLKLK